MSFTHLHLHTLYSLLDGAIRMKDLIKTVKEKGMNSVAVTDHGNMFGTIQFYEEAKKWGIKPILGCEAYISDGAMSAKTDRKNYHIVLLAKIARLGLMFGYDFFAGANDWLGPDDWDLAGFAGTVRLEFGQYDTDPGAGRKKRRGKRR